VFQHNLQTKKNLGIWYKEFSPFIGLMEKNLKVVWNSLHHFFSISILIDRYYQKLNLIEKWVEWRQCWSNASKPNSTQMAVNWGEIIIIPLARNVFGKESAVSFPWRDQNQSNHSGQPQKTTHDNFNQVHVADAKRGITCASELRLVLFLLVIEYLTCMVQTF